MKRASAVDLHPSTKITDANNDIVTGVVKRLLLVKKKLNDMRDPTLFYGKWLKCVPFFYKTSLKKFSWLHI